MVPIADVYKDDTMEDPLAYLEAYDNSYEEESTEYPQYTQDEEELSDDPWNASRDMPEPEAEEDPYNNESDTPEYPDTTEYPEIPERSDNEYDWPTNRMCYRQHGK